MKQKTSQAKYLTKDNKKKRKTMVGVGVTLFIVVACVLVYIGIRAQKHRQLEYAEKKPNEYTWQEFEALDDAQKEQFLEWFESPEAFDAWLDAAQGTAQTDGLVLPWEDDGKAPSEYTIQEFNALTAIQQEAFFEWFDSAEAFEAWKDSAEKDAQAEAMVMPWDEGGKTPAEYTMKEFNALTVNQQEAFFEWFDSAEAFEAWKDSAEKDAQAEAMVMPWDEGSKTPAEYTMEEFNALTANQQEAFFEWFDSAEAFETWYNNAK